ncbi:unnamed protein product [Spirodela intermedia]|uniref:Uncharacterized protein n=1 Tax=Spirodela intermedia TaxID=51605 RepID=A0A7I8J0N2_SPIIN|nr:unnamed protein product [Spirodela intermedia]CAA6663697.1 unnamed protein product [Spirodela intermedia]
MGGTPRPLRAVGAAAGFLVGGFLAVTLGTVATYEAVRKRDEARREVGAALRSLQREGFQACKLCRGSSTVEWSPLYDPIAISPCLCPHATGESKIQRCLNCIGKGYF